MGDPAAWQRLHAWYRSPLGRRVATAEHAALSAALAPLSRGAVVCIGPLSGRLHLSSAVRQWCIGGDFGDLRADPRWLPFRRHALDALVLVHTLEFWGAPEVILNEALQVVRPGGRLLALTFNPLGLWGAARLWGQWWGADAPWCGRQWTVSALAVRLRREGCNEIATRYLCFRPPLKTARLQTQLDPWEDVAGRLGRLSAGVQMVSARRHEWAPSDPLAALRRVEGRLPAGGVAQPAGCMGGRCARTERDASHSSY